MIMWLHLIIGIAIGMAISLTLSYTYAKRQRKLDAPKDNVRP